MILQAIKHERLTEDAIYVHDPDRQVIFIIYRDGRFDQTTDDPLVQNNLKLAIDLMENFNTYFDSLP